MQQRIDGVVETEYRFFHLGDHFEGVGVPRELVKTDRQRQESGDASLATCQSTCEGLGMIRTLYTDGKCYCFLDNYQVFTKYRKGEEGCIDFHKCGQDVSTYPTESLNQDLHATWEAGDRGMTALCPGYRSVNEGRDKTVGVPVMDEMIVDNGVEYYAPVWADYNIPRWFGNSIYEGCCRCSGGYRGHGIPESAIRWMFSADDNSIFLSETKELSTVTSTGLTTYHPGPNPEAQTEWAGSFFYAPYNNPIDFHLDGVKGACFAPRGTEHYIQMWLGHGRETITGITTKGGEGGYITNYTMAVSVDTEVWFDLECVTQDQNGYCIGNSDKDTAKFNDIISPGRGKYIRLYPKAWVSTLDEDIPCVRLGVTVTQPKCQNTFSINSEDDNILGTQNSPTIVGKDTAINNICEAACRNGFVNIPDIGPAAYATDGKTQTVSDLLARLYNGCCECSAEAQARPTDGSFWHVRMSSQKSATAVTERMSVIEGQPDLNNWLTWGSTSPMSKWWTPRAYDRNNLAAKVNAPMLPAYYAYRKEIYAAEGYSSCPMGDPSMCENDCSLCKRSKTGYNCAGTCSQCLLGGECDNTPAPDGSTRCTCVSDSLDARSGCCPMGFSLLTGGNILARDGQVNGIKAGFVTFYERNRGEKYNGAAAFYNPPTAPHTDDERDQMGSDFNAQLAFGFSEHNPAGGNSSNPFAKAGYENLKRDQFQAGCYPCPGMFTALSLCDRELEEGELCSEEETELTQERMWNLKQNCLRSLKMSTTCGY